ncbi:hypothetical protein [Mariniblastus fucicola]|uniref:Uncharacterized protein n=1 Tax=Mariniblastus fucicola TaxID=980251 RepID=A0A5B9P7D1_9BACT|nr:hypothetical protein [Mariniblastus fucicola]QEG22234.1 hypothetical protein MFFC18_21100 [Mariniblastus fucicola]
MLAFKIILNGDVICTAGADDGHRVLGAALSWTHRTPDDIDFHVSGVPETNQLFDYDVPAIKIGDKITIEVVDTDDISKPDTVKPPNDWR